MIVCHRFGGGSFIQALFTLASLRTHIHLCTRIQYSRNVIVYPAQCEHEHAHIGSFCVITKLNMTLNSILIAFQHPQ